MSEPLKYQIRVSYEDTDFSGYVYHANYLKYCERARSDYLRVIGVDQNAMFADGQAFVVRRMDCEFLRPAKFEDVLDVETRFVGISGARLESAQLVKRGAEEIFSAKVTVAIIDRQGRPMRIAKELVTKFSR